jgi:hypothetical protein
VLRGSVDGQLFGLIGAIDGGRADMDAVEVFSRRWMSWEPGRVAGLGIIEAALVCERLRNADRLDLACHLTLCAVRGAWASAGQDESKARLVADAATRLFTTYAELLWDACDDLLLSPNGLVGYSGFSAWITYPIRSVRLAELAALLALKVRAENPESTDAIANRLARFFQTQPGAARPISDRYAVSVVPAAALLVSTGHRERAIDLLRAATVWMCDRYERGELGLAEVGAPPEEEVARVLGTPFESVQFQRRQSSQLAGVLLDLTALLGLGELYADVRNDGLAVQLYPSVLVPADGPDMLSRTGLDNRLDVNPDYADELPRDGQAAPHIRRDAAVPSAVPTDRWWDLLAISAALRDRHFPAAITAAGASPIASDT